MGNETSHIRCRTPSASAVSRAARSNEGHSFFSTDARQQFFGPVIQPKLKVNAPDDAFEREADRMAEAVVSEPAAPEMRSAPSIQPLSDSIQPLRVSIQRLSAHVIPVQRKCAACEEEELQREEAQEDPAASTLALAADLSDAGPPNAVQRLAIDCTKLTKSDQEIDAEDDQEAEAVGGAADVQRKCAECEKAEEEGIQRQESAPAGTVSPSFETALESSRGAGATLPSETRSFMEDRFGADFGSVRVHTDASSELLNRSINARAFTHGQDIYFDRGQYNPGTSDGRQLLAHELTHVIQQNGSTVQRRNRQNIRSELPDIQRSYYFAPYPKVSGRAIHAAILPQFVAANSDLFIEVSIPGATKKDTDKGKAGAADFYKARTTIGLKFAAVPMPLRQAAGFQAGATAHAAGAAFKHTTHSAPRGYLTSPRVRRLNEAPTEIEIGDLKPGASSESVLGQSQIGNYKSGITTTKNDLNSYLRINPAESDTSTKAWGANPTDMSTLAIPTELNYTMGAGIRGLQNRPLALYREGDKSPHIQYTGLHGTVFVYKDTPPGVWAYEWFPENIPIGTGSARVNTVLNRLNNEVIPALNQTQGTAIAPKRASTARPVIMRKPKTFSDEKWKRDLYNPWKKEATNVLRDQGEVKKADVAVAIVDVEKRSRLKVKAPQEVKEQGKGMPKLRHWKRFGAFYGWLREKFDTLFVKVKGVVDKVKNKVSRLARRAGSSTFGNWVKAVAKVVFKIFKMVGSWVVIQVMDKLLNSLRTGVMNNVNNLIEKITPDDAKKYLIKFCELKATYDEVIAQKEEDIIKLLFGDTLQLFETAEEIEKKIGYVADIATLIEWGVRLLACASPPAIGCLWNLAIEAIKWIFARLIQTCWFTKEVYAPVINKVELVKKFPSTLAASLVNILNEKLPVPAGLDHWFAEVKVDISEFKVDCNEAADGSARLTPARAAIMEIVKEPNGDEKLKAAIEMMLKRGAGPWVLMTEERASKLKEALKTTGVTEINEATKNDDAPVPAGMQAIMDEIASYTPTEKQLIAEAKAERARKAAEAALKKEIEEILADKKAQEALAKPYPSNSQLLKDLETVEWDPMPKGSGAFISIGGRTLFIIKTQTKATAGGYFKYFEREVDGVKRNMILELGPFYARDEIPRLDGIDFSLRDNEGNPGLLFYVFDRPVAKGSFFDLGQAVFFGKYVEIQ